MGGGGGACASATRLGSGRMSSGWAVWGDRVEEAFESGWLGSQDWKRWFADRDKSRQLLKPLWATFCLPQFLRCPPSSGSRLLLHRQAAANRARLSEAWSIPNSWRATSRGGYHNKTEETS